MQSSIRALILLGPLPRSSEATASAMQELQAQLSNVQTPVSDAEAKELAKLFGPDDCFGLGWTLLHLIETSPGWPIKEALIGLEGEWIDRLRERAG